MPFSVYNILHFLGVFLLVGAVSGIAFHAAGGASREGPAYRALMIMHGLGAVIALIAGFGMLAKLAPETGSFFPAWAWLKLLVWLVLVAAVAIPYRKRAWALAVGILAPLLAFVAALVATVKPF